MVVRRTRGEVTARIGSSQSVLVRERAGRDRDVTAVVDDEKMTQLGQPWRDRGDSFTKTAVEDDGNRVGIVEQVLELLGDVAVVHVDRYSPQLQQRDKSLDPLATVVGIDGDVVADPDATRGEVVSQLVRARLELGVGDFHRGRSRQDQRHAIRDRVDGELDHVGDVEAGHVSGPSGCAGVRARARR